jgi:hydroxyacylglutathione hydrolase|tara:strand:- start:139 stop:897 length:759 start_codon:yes stop_codon:yes gene_type:complete
MFNISIIPCLNDNYSYICFDNKNDAFVVDPSEFKPVDEYISNNQLNLKYVLNTHHHFDHVGGNYELKQKYNCKVIGSKLDENRIPEVDILLKEGEKWKFKEDAAQIIEIPGHTTGHIAFYFSNQKIVFTGDTLFSLGCGRLFEGTPEMMWNSLQKLRNLPDDTKIYCGHEYTLNNALFTKSVIPGELIDKKISSLNDLLSKKIPSIPSTIAEEKKLNLFFQADDSILKKELRLEDKNNIDMFAYLRNLKDNY